ncbi:MAG: formyltetrahydrofolate deformylase [Gammaproteobacteria bacterium]|nr:formyltetrahydrofolate deformylase [Gammaproteobacteria bacterium]MDE0368155.1 formyltetrahydrofolate deformylase [Gammaproteobacteria bacterium]
MGKASEYILTLHCPDRPGLVFAVSQWLMGYRCNIVASDQFGDLDTRRFFMRIRFSGEVALDVLRSSFTAVAAEHSMTWKLHPSDYKPKVLVMVSQYEHCLADLLYRARVGDMPIEIVLVVSNHTVTRYLVTAFGIDYMHLPITKETKAGQEKKVLAEVEARGVDFVVLARYMQILTAETCAALPGRIINIHHSYLPSFKGARPYIRAHERGVKLIGATAHYVTADLDEGPIIAQITEPVDHRQTPNDLVALGSNIETQVLARAVRYQAEHRVLLNGARTVVFQ